MKDKSNSPQIYATSSQPNMQKSKARSGLGFHFARIFFFEERGTNFFFDVYEDSNKEQRMRRRTRPWL